MAFTSTMQRTEGTALITLAGELDAASAPAFKSDIEAAAGAGLEHLVLLVQDLDYIASAGLRVLIFAKQKMGPGVDIYVIGAQEQITDTLQKTGFDRSCILQETYVAA